MKVPPTSHRNPGRDGLDPRSAALFGRSAAGRVQRSPTKGKLVTSIIEANGGDGLPGEPAPPPPPPTPDGGPGVPNPPKK